MDKRTLGLLGGLVVMLMASGAWAVPTTETPVGKASSPRHSDAEARSHQMTGVISTVDHEAKTITVQVRDGQRTVTLSPRVQIKVGKMKASLAELQPGKQVFIRYRDVEGKAVATTVKVL